MAKKIAKPGRAAPAAEVRLVFERDGREVWHGDCRAWLAAREPGRFSACVTDPPYELGFMGRKWDKSGVSFDPETWHTVLRALKPGAHLVAFGGTRTFHRIACAIEDGGFEIRDVLMWVYSSGFPKGRNVANDLAERAKQAAEYDLRFVRATYLSKEVYACKECGQVLLSCLQKQSLSESRAKETKSENAGIKQSRMEGRSNIRKGSRQLQRCQACQVSHGILADGAERRVRDGTSSCDGEAHRKMPHTKRSGTPQEPRPARQPYRESDTVLLEQIAQAFRGWNVALKPAWEPIILARKPLDGTVAECVLRHGTGALNVDATRIGTDEDTARKPSSAEGHVYAQDKYTKAMGRGGRGHTKGRWPPNAIFQHDARCVRVGTEPSQGPQRAAGSLGFGSGRRDGYEKGEGRVYHPGGEREVWACVPGCPVRMLDGQSGVRTSGSRKAGVRKGMGYHGADGDGGPAIEGNSGTASRFFYCPKANASERRAGLSMLEANLHPTVKPVALMEWLLRLVAPPGGEVLDPFAGSGSTLVAAKRLGVRAVGIDLDAAACDVAAARLTRRTASGVVKTRKLKLGKRRRKR